MFRSVVARLRDAGFSQQERTIFYCARDLAQQSLDPTPQLLNEELGEDPKLIAKVIGRLAMAGFDVKVVKP